MKKTTTKAGPVARVRRMKCACGSCQCTVDAEHGFRKGNLVYCNKVCATRCTMNQCMCEHNECER